MLCMVSGTGNAGAVVTANDYDVGAGLLVAEEAGATWTAHRFEREGRTFTVYVAAESAAFHARLEALVLSVLPR